MKIVILPLRSAVLCANCTAVSNATGETCPACGSPSLLCIDRLLGRKPVEKAELVELEVAHA